MPKLTVEGLKDIREQNKHMLAVRGGACRAKIVFYLGTCGIAAGGRDLMNALMDELAGRSVHDVAVAISGCAGFCSEEPMAAVEMGDAEPVRYARLDKEKISKILTEHVLGGKVVQEYVFVEPEKPEEPEKVQEASE